MEAEDKGHRHGNFSNYYHFHPPQNRLQVLEQCGLMAQIRRGLFASNEKSSCQGDTETSAEQSHRKKPRIDDSLPTDCKDIYYCDLGCNEGDLTMAMASCLNKCVHNTEQTIKCLGLDVDPALIQRANDKFSRNNDGHVGENSEKEEYHTPVFKACNLCSDLEHNNACSTFFASNNKQQEPKPKQMFSLTSIFSTTMWIHIHSGDDGLTRFLERACGWTKQYLLIEPQHSGCYRKANVRLRKMGRPEIDVSSTRLKMRNDIEKEIEKVVAEYGFQRVTLNVEDEGQQQGDKTAWNRTLQLYERKQVTTQSSG